ncbi:MAG: TldD protein [Candidatus Binatota bacterium]|nr:TldD protein [Candidatus Binatota bacterium]
METTPIEAPKRFFFDRYGLSDGELEHVLGSALERRADHADLYFEFRLSESVQLEESIVKSASRNVSQGVGVRVLAGDRTGYAYSDEITRDKLEIAASSARQIAASTGTGLPEPLTSRSPRADLYRLEHPPVEAELARKIELLSRIDVEARHYDPRIKNVLASIACEQKVVLIVTSSGVVAEDVQPLLRLQVTCVAEDGDSRQRGSFGGGGRSELEFLLEADPSEPDLPRFLKFTREAASQAVRNLDSVEAPAGSQTVVLGSGWPGILLHEAIGHGLEADFNRKGVSAFSNRLNQRVGSELCTVVDDGTIAARRGSLNVDDEGTPTSRTVLIEKGILKGYLQDRLNAALLRMPLTGNGRRESFAHIPMPRMTNTFMLAGEDDPADIIRSVDRGLYAVYFGGGQVDITNGKFVFSASEAYLIEGGRLTRPVKGATLIGSGPEVLKRISRVGSDLRLDEGIGTCGKDGQSVPVGVGLPTIRIDGLTVGGTRV